MLLLVMEAKEKTKFCQPSLLRTANLEPFFYGNREVLKNGVQDVLTMEVFAEPCLSFFSLKKKRASGSVPLPISLSYMHCVTGTAHLSRSGCPKLFTSFTSRLIGSSADTTKSRVF